MKNKKETLVDANLLKRSAFFTALSIWALILSSYWLFDWFRYPFTWLFYWFRYANSPYDFPERNIIGVTYFIGTLFSIYFSLKTSRNLWKYWQSAQTNTARIPMLLGLFIFIMFAIAVTVLVGFINYLTLALFVGGYTSPFFWGTIVFITILILILIWRSTNRAYNLFWRSERNLEKQKSGHNKRLELADIDETADYQIDKSEIEKFSQV